MDLEQNKMNEELQFQDFPSSSQDSGKSQTHTFTNFPHSAESEDEDGDKAELLKDEKKPPSFWTFEYYQQFFDVDTHQVLHRTLGSMMPRPGRNFLTSQIRPNPDLYGPFWICTTLVFTTAIAGNMANYLQSGGKTYKWKYDFHKVTFAATAIFSYWWLIPTALFGLLWWRQSQAKYTFLEMISVYGYSLAIYIPISILWVIQVNALQWVLVVLGAVLSGSVLLLTFWPAVKEDNKRVASVVMALIFIFHAALAAGFVLYFFHVPAAVTAPSTISPVHNQTVSSVSLAGLKGKQPLIAQDKTKDDTGSKLGGSLPLNIKTRVPASMGSQSDRKIHGGKPKYEYTKPASAGTKRDKPKSSMKQAKKKMKRKSILSVKEKLVS